jgi:hypothetical protein
MQRSTTDIQPRSDAALCQAAQEVVRVLRGELPKPEEWRAALLSIPLEGWHISITSSRDCVLEKITAELHFPGTHLRCTLEAQTSIAEDFTSSLETSGGLYYSRAEAVHANFANSARIDLANFPETIAGLMSVVRERLIEPGAYAERLSAALRSAREWRENEHWGLDLLKQAQQGNQAPAELEQKAAIELAESILRRERGPSEEGDYYEFDQLVAAQRFEFDAAKICAIRFYAPMYDRHGNGYPNEYLYLQVMEPSGRSPRVAEFLFDSAFGPEFAKFASLAGKAWS